MESPSAQSTMHGSMSGQSTRSRSSTKPLDDVVSLTSFNPFSDEDEHDQSSYNLVTSFLSKMKSISGPLSSAVTSASAGSTTTYPASTAPSGVSEIRRPSLSTAATSNSTISNKTASDRPHSLFTAPSQIAPPLVSLTPAQSEVPTFSIEYEQGTPRQGGMPYSPFESTEGGAFGTSIPGFPIPDDTRSIKTSTSYHRSHSVSKVMRKIRGEGLSRDYWMDDENARECYDCKSVFTTWRRKHHCRICGQIFCSRCASNVIKGVRFGHDGMIRVCNLCLGKLAIDEDDDEDDRRSVVSSTFPAHQLGQFTGESFTPGRHPPSPFAVSQMYGRADEPFNLFSISESKRLVHGYNSDDTDSRPLSPYFIESSDNHWETAHDNPAPFRRAMSDDDGDSAGISSTLIHDDPTSSSKKGMDIPSKPLNIDVAVSSIQFPLGSPEQDSPRPESRHKFSHPFYGEYEVATPFIRSRVQSRLDSIATGEPGWRTRRESTAYAQELNLASMLHLKIMLRQMLTIEAIPNIKEWEEVLLRLALRIAKEMTFTALPHRQGQDMDVRRYVKIKKIPGGTPKDSEYVNGAVITKNVAHKQMSRLLHNPRVMLVTFPLEFHRVEGQYMHFGQIVRQEKEYLTNLASRIAALRPHVVLVEKSVSRIALDALAKHNIAVARTVKTTAVQTVARMTQGDVFSSMDKLALEPRLGHCARFRIQTFDHHLIPGRRKTYMRFEGCTPDMGCTILLRGGDIETLRRIKKVTRFLTFIVRNLKLETHLWKDTVISLPSFNPEATPSGHSRHTSNFSLSSLGIYPSSVSNTSIVTPIAASGERSAFITVVDEDGKETEVLDEDGEQRRLSKRIDEALEPYKRTFISVSATLRFPPPYPIQRMKELENELSAAKRAWEDEVIRLEEQTQARHRQEATITQAPAPAAITNVHELEQQQEQQTSELEDLSAQIDALPSTHLVATPNAAESFGVPYLSPAAMDEADSYFLPMNSIVSPTSIPTVVLTGPGPEQEEMEPLKTVNDINLQSQYSLIKWKHEEHRRIWEWYLRKNKDDFVVEKYQCISLREHTVPVNGLETNRPCFPPTLQYITFYGENDMTLGQFIEKSVADTLVQFLDPKAICQGKACDQPLARHGKVFIHNSTRIFIAVEQWDGQIKARAVYYPPDLIMTWSTCRVCGTGTPFIPVSEEMQRYSFAKFLEAYFYPSDVKLVQGAGCQHNIYQHHIRYFASKGMTIAFQTDPITLQELVFPPFRIRVRPETQLEIKNRDFNQLHQRNNRWYDGLVHDLKQYAIEAATGDEETDARLLTDINALINKAEGERRDVIHLINKVYRETNPTDTLALNQLHAYRQDKIVAWQSDFDRLSRLRPPQSERPSKRTSAFGSVRAMWKYDLTGAFSDSHFHSSNVSEAEEGPIKPRRSTGESFTSSTSDDHSEADSNPDSATTNTTKSDEKSVGELTEKSSIVETPPQEVSVGDTAAQPVPLTAEPPAAIPSTQIRETDVDKVESERQDSGPDSDSTIEAVRDDVAPQGRAKDQAKTIPDLPATEIPVSRLSRLPRRAQPNVAELVRKYSDYLPPQGVQELTKTALAPKSTMSESEQEYPTLIPRRPAPRTRTRHLIARKPSTSDFEQGYAANVAPRHLGHLTKSNGSGSNTTGSHYGVLESRDSSRRPSPEKRASYSYSKSKGRDVPSRPASPTRRASFNRPSKIRVPSHSGHGKDKLPSRPPSAAPTKTTFRRPPPPAPGKVTNIAKHFERLGRDSERTKSKYTVLRGKRARPVTSARAKVEILDSIKVAIRDDSASSDSSSEADDEGEGEGMEEEAPPKPSQKSQKEVPEKVEDSQDPDTPTPETPAEDPSTSTPLTASTVEGSDAGESDQGLRTAPIQEVTSIPPSPFLDTVKSRADAMTPPMSDTENGGERISILKALSGFWPQQSHHIFDDPFGDPEHIFRDSDMVVRLDEPTSIIALALNSPKYRELLAKSRADKRTARAEATLLEGTEAFMPDDLSAADSSSTWGVLNVDAAETIDPTEDPRSFSSTLPWAITFEPSGGLTISCTVLYPEQFDAIRKMFNCEKSIVESLARCVKWKASGGKSGSAFLKTQDDRFIAKELSRAELQTMETFAPAYFEYMSSAVAANRPTLLAKVFGCYKLTFKRTGKDRGSGKNKSTQMNLLVMENLFYDRRFARIYDLKGSTRNRHVHPTGQDNEVLLDENLVEAAHINPFYLREHSKRILRGALYNDSKFLADINVMDYSLVCGVDSQNNELVLGIVDYIRTYTWDKKLESWVKESTFLGGAGKGEPTIVTPKQYRQRFLSAMERYLPMVPDRWMKHKDEPEEDSSSLSELWPDW